MLIIDGDYPMAGGATLIQRDLTLPIDKVRSAEPLEPQSPGRPDNATMASLPELRRGSVAAAIVKVGACILRDGHPHGEVRSDDLAYARAQGEMAYYRILQTRGEVRLLKTSRDFTEHMQVWSETEDHDDLPVGFVLGMEGADPILWPDQVHEWYEDGLRVVSLSHYGFSRYSHGTGTGTDGGLLNGAVDLLKNMDSLGMILDVSHTSDESIRQELDNFSGPVLSTHQNCRTITPGERQLSDELLRQIIDRGAVMGHSMDAHMLWPPGVDWQNLPETPPFAKEDVTLEDFVDHIDHVSQMAGNTLHSAIGGDTDGQGGAGNAPLEIDTVADYQKVAEVMDKRGYKQEDIENVMYRNWQRFFEKSLPD
ncbi:MAG: membrane dipeptidase [Chloroflexi bacterium]|nr:membrane dipeptidase [Chloroflexota bacterium]